MESASVVPGSSTVMKTLVSSVMDRNRLGDEE
jgi:hypothetical protein